MHHGVPENKTLVRPHDEAPVDTELGVVCIADAVCERRTQL